MKHFIYIILTIAALGATFASCGSSKNNNEAKPEKKVLVAYFSATGNTRKIANDVAEIMGGKLHEITPAEAYTEKDLDWHDTTSRSYVEMHTAGSRPAITDSVENIDQYNIIFLGYPIWWDKAPAVINTFIDKYGLEKKSVVCFATSGGSQVWPSVDSLRAEHPQVNFWGERLLNVASKAGLEKWKADCGL